MCRYFRIKLILHLKQKQCSKWELWGLTESGHQQSDKKKKPSPVTTVAQLYPLSRPVSLHLQQHKDTVHCVVSTQCKTSNWNVLKQEGWGSSPAERADASLMRYFFEALVTLSFDKNNNSWRLCLTSSCLFLSLRPWLHPYVCSPNVPLPATAVREHFNSIWNTEILKYKIIPK